MFDLERREVAERLRSPLKGRLHVTRDLRQQAPTTLGIRHRWRADQPTPRGLAIADRRGNGAARRLQGAEGTF